MLYQYALTLLPPELALSGRFTVTRTFCPWFDGRSNPDLTPPAEFATFRSMNALLQTGSSLSACGHAQAGGRVPVPPEKRFLINDFPTMPTTAESLPLLIYFFLYTLNLYLVKCRQHHGSAFGWTIPTKHRSRQ